LLSVVHTSTRHTGRRQTLAPPTAVALVAGLAVLVAVIAGRHDPSAADVLSGAVAPTPSSGHSGATSTDRDGAAVRIELVIGNNTATATLSDTPEARDFADMLPITLEMDDLFGQAKTSQLPRELDVDHATRSRSYRARDLSYWSPTGKPASKIAIVYDSWGLSVPPPGLVRLGTVDAGLDAIASAGRDFTMTIRRAR
jgi:hypothetical protein